MIRSLKEQCIHSHRFEALQQASRVIDDWINFYNQLRPLQTLGMKTPAEAVPARPEQVSVGHYMAAHAPGRHLRAAFTLSEKRLPHGSRTA